MNIVKKIIWKILNAFHLGAPIQLILNGFLVESGWYKSFYNKESVDKDNNPIPWFTYSAITYIKPRLSKNFEIFEFGSGNSSIWFANYTNKVISIEHDEDWYNHVSDYLPENVILKLFSLDDGSNYQNSILTFEQNFDVIIIDGRRRVECVKTSVKKLKQNGVIIFDNSDRKEYSDAIIFLKNKGFSQIDFWGMGPIVTINSCTSIFYRNKNCFEI